MDRSFVERTSVHYEQHGIEHIRFMLKEFNIPEQLESLKQEDTPAIAKSALKEAHFNYPVPKYMNQSECEKLLQKMIN